LKTKFCKVQSQKNEETQSKTYSCKLRSPRRGKTRKQYRLKSNTLHLWDLTIQTKFLSKNGLTILLNTELEQSCQMIAMLFFSMIALKWFCIKIVWTLYTSNAKVLLKEKILILCVVITLSLIIQASLKRKWYFCNTLKAI